MSRQQYAVLNEITLSRQALLSNYRYYSHRNPQAQIAPVLKSNAYGHGLHEVASIVEQDLPQAPFICVDSLYEAYELHKLAIKIPTLVMGYTNPHNYSIWKKLPFHFAVFDQQTLLALNQDQPGAKIHIKLDTGMCRLGLRARDIPEFIHTLKLCNNLVVEGIFSHFSQADNPAKTTFTHRQISLFKTMTALFENAGFKFKWKHIAATAGASFLQDPYFNLVRLGLGFYGYTPFGPHTKEGRVGRQHLLPVLELTSHIAQIKAVEVGAEVGYGGTYRAKQKETLAILPLGYNEGLSRSLSNQGVVTLAGQGVCQIVGNISMNMTTIRLPRGSRTQLGDPVTIISRNSSDPNSLGRHAQIINEIDYTLLTGLHPSIRRRII